MRIFIDIGHPAHVHYFRNFIKRMTQRGHEFCITARDKEISLQLLERYNISYTCRGTGSNSPIGKLLYLPKANLILLKQAIKFKPDIFLSFSSPYAAQVSAIMRKPHIAFDDTEHATLGRKLYAPFTDVILSPESFRGKSIPKQKRFRGFMELLYLHPDCFSPNPTILKEINVEIGERFSFLRFVSWSANHDIGEQGLNTDFKRKLVSNLEKHGKVFISSEEKLPDDLEKYQIRISPDYVHHLLYYASLFMGESATMASESAILGTPAIYFDKVGRGYTDALQDVYGLVYNYNFESSNIDSALRKGLEIISDGTSDAVYAQKRKELLDSVIDVNEFLFEVVESFQSIRQH